MKKILLYILFCCFPIAPLTLKAQTKFNLSISNGLPDILVYTSMVDHFGYLWIGTPNGVIRYNGYELKKITTADGLPSDDVWQLVEDKQGRIWLGSIADKLGYIQNEKYHAATFKNQKYNTIYPHGMTRLQNSIAFFSLYASKSMNTHVCIENNDTIRSYPIMPLLTPFIKEVNNSENQHFIECYINNQGESYVICLPNYILKLKLHHEGPSIIGPPITIKDPGYISTFGDIRFRIVNNYLISIPYYMKQSVIHALNLKTGAVTQSNLKQYGVNEKILDFDCLKGDTVYTVTENNIIFWKVADTVKFLFSTPITLYSQYNKLRGEYITTFNKNELWGSLLSTRHTGLNISLDATFLYHDLGIDLTNFRYSGSIPSGTSIWWNELTSTLCSISPDNKVRFTTANPLTTKQKEYQSHYVHLGARHLFYDYKTNEICQLTIRRFNIRNYVSAKDTPNVLYGISNYGFLRSSVNIDNPEAEKYIEKDKFNGLAFDTTNRAFWVYNKKKIFVYSSTSSKTYTQNDLTCFGVSSIEKICIDNVYQNVFILGDGKLCLYDSKSQKFSYILPKFNLRDASITVVKDVLVVYGKFGLLYIKILGRGKLSSPVYFNNVKNTVYNKIYDANFTVEGGIINTDKGALTVPFNLAATTIGDEPTAQSRLLSYYKGSPTQINSGDTILLDQDQLSLRFDIINPYGNGKLIYSIEDSKGKNALNGNEYNLPSGNRAVDEYHKIIVSVNDDVWNRSPATIYVYIRPYWYQTVTMTRIIWILSIAGFIGLIAGAILITRRLVLSTTRKRNLRMELELKSIYAQINPHFIFNSLNSALLLVSKSQMEEAYTHISKFSRLLRSYIKSSRNKYILLIDEIKNLTNYIDLQQVRFKNKFDYQVVVDEEVNAADTQIPSLLLQPFVENAIEHGLLNKNEKGNLLIHFKLNAANKKLLCIIEDDGIGREESKLNKVPNPIKDESYGELLIKDLVNIFNKYEHMNISVSYTDRKPPLTGTSVIIEIDISR